MKNVFFMFGVVLLAGISGFTLQQFLSGNESGATQTRALESHNRRVSAELSGQRRPDFAMKDLHGTLRNINEWDGKILLVNFWATWCPPCMKEIPAFVELQEEYAAKNFQIIGIAIDEEEAVRDFADAASINYPVFIGEQEAIELSSRFGNQYGALPFSAFIDQHGSIVKVKAGELNKKQVEAIIDKLSRG